MTWQQKQFVSFVGVTSAPRISKAKDYFVGYLLWPPDERLIQVTASEALPFWIIALGLVWASRRLVVPGNAAKQDQCCHRHNRCKHKFFQCEIQTQKDQGREEFERRLLRAKR